MVPRAGCTGRGQQQEQLQGLLWEEQSRDCPRTDEVGDAVGDGARRSDEGVVALVVLHLHLKEPCRANRELRALPDHPQPGSNLSSIPLFSTRHQLGVAFLPILFPIFLPVLFPLFLSVFLPLFLQRSDLSSTLPLLPLRFNTSGKRIYPME